ncbi:MAG: aspartate-semialdehyde dehydrogenase [Phycisphaerales bacterium]|nr:aspartate-semialdehyde dehydrogenase [Phycisphaerales bacterium]
MQKDLGQDRPTIAVVGATGAVGAEFVSLLAAQAIRPGRLRLFASARSAGKRVEVGGQGIDIEALGPGCFDAVDIAFFSAGKGVATVWAPQAVASGAWVIDNSSAFRMDPAVPLVIPEVNAAALDACAGPSIVAVPNCSTIVALVAVTPLHAVARVKRMIISTYQAASGAGAAAMRELESQAHDFVHGRPLQTDIFGRQYLFNCFSHNSAVGESGYNEEEAKILYETRKIWSDQSVRVTATCVRVPVLRAHCESIALEFERPLTEGRAREILAAAPGVELVDDRARNAFPEPIIAAGRDPVLVGRIRSDWSLEPGMGLQLFVAGDQIRIGAALTGVRIAQRIMSRVCA